MSSIPPRTAVLVLTLRDGHVLGQLPPIDVATPWWQDARPIVEAARQAFGLDVVILRLLTAEPPRYPGGEVTYLAEVAEPLTEAARERLAPWTGQLVDDPLRLAYAAPGGPDADILIGSGGADQLFGRGGADLLCANDGHGIDRLDGGPSNDRFRADPGDVLVSVELPDPCTAR